MSAKRSHTVAPGFGVVGFLVVMELGSGMLQGWFSPLLRVIGEEFHATSAALNWVSAIYMLATVAFVPILAKLGDMFGHKRLLAIAATLVTIGSLVVAFAPTFELFLLGRALQAPLAAFLPLEFAIVRERDEKRSGRSIGVLVGSLTLGAALGALGAGVLYGVTQSLQLVLLVPAIFMAVCVPVVIFLVPETSVRKRGRIDWAGAVLLTVGLLSALTGISNGAVWGWIDARTLGSIVFGVGALVLWVFVERRATDPMVDLATLTSGRIGLPLIAALLFGAQLYGSQTASFLWVLADPEAVGYGLGLPTAAAGGIIVVYALAAFVGTLLGDRLSRRIGAGRAAALGAVVTAASFLLMILFSASAPFFVTWFALGAFGGGIILAVLPAVVVKNSAPDSVGIASAMYNTARTVAGAAAGAAFALVMSLFVATVTVDGTDTAQSTSASFFAVWGICVAVALALAGVALRFPVPAGTQDSDIRRPEGAEASASASSTSAASREADA